MPRSYEKRIAQMVAAGIESRPTHDMIGHVRHLNRQSAYIKHVSRRLTSLSELKGLRWL